MSKSTFVKMFDEKIKEGGFSLRRVGREIGVAHTTIANFLEGGSADLDTVIAISSWLKVDPSLVLDSFAKNDSAIMSSVIMIMKTHKALFRAFSDAIVAVEKEGISTTVINEIAAYAAYRINIEMMS